MTLFVTHYPPITEFARLYPDHVTNHHMSFLINDPDGQEVDSEGKHCKFDSFYRVVEKDVCLCVFNIRK